MQVAAKRSSVLEVSWAELLTALSVLFGGGGGFVWFKVWYDGRAAKRLSSDAVEIAQIETDSSERIHLVDILTARVGALEKHNSEQDTEMAELRDIIAELRHSDAQKDATITLLQEQNGLLRRGWDQSEKQRIEAVEEARILRDSLQGAVTEALDTLEISSEPIDD